MYVTYPSHLIPLDFVTLIICSKEYKSQSSSLCNYLQHPVTSSLAGPSISLSTLFTTPPVYVNPLM
jgi:hypothetical protein